MVRVVVWAVVALGSGTAVAAEIQPAKPCLIVDVPQQHTQVAALGTYAGQQLEFRITVDGKPLDFDPQKASKEQAAACIMTS